MNTFADIGLPATASLPQLVRLAHQRWTIEQHRQDCKAELELDQARQRRAGCLKTGGGANDRTQAMDCD